MSILAQVYHLVTPLREDAQCILEEGYDDEEAPDSWHIPGGASVSPVAHMQSTSLCKHKKRVLVKRVKRQHGHPHTALTDATPSPAHLQSCSSARESFPEGSGRWLNRHKGSAC